jgi:tetratricopeptide (TPR) repeat protein
MSQRAAQSVMQKPGIRPQVVIALLLVALTANATLLVWRWAHNAELPPGTYHEYQIRQWEHLSLEKPDDPLVWATLGGLYEASGAEGKADSAYVRALEFDPDNVAALMHLAEADVAEGNHDAGRTRLQRAASVLPEGGAYLVYYRLGRLEEDALDPDRALAAYEASIAEKPTYWNAHFRIALIHENAGRMPEALAAAEEAARFVPDDEIVQGVIDRLRRAQAGS